MRSATPNIEVTGEKMQALLMVNTHMASQMDIA